MVGLLLSILAGALGQVCLKKGMLSIGGTSMIQLLKSPWILVSNAWIVAGFLLYASSFALWLVVLSRVELSKAYPMVSLGYLVTFVLGILLFREEVSLVKIAGMAIILAGVALLAWS